MSNKIKVLIQSNVQATKEHLETIVKSIEGLNLTSNDSSHLIIYELESDADFANITEHIKSGYDGKIFLTAKNIDQQLLIKAMRAGVKEFFTQPLNQEEITSALQNFIDENQQLVQKEANGQVISIIGSKGGIGTTTIAVNLAAMLKKMKENSSVCLLDMNMLCGEVPLFLDLKPTYHWGEIVKNIDRLDGTYLMNILAEHKSGIHVLPAPIILNGYVPNSADVIKRMLSQIQKHFDYIIIDGGPKMSIVTLGAFELSKEVLLVSNLSLPSLANTTNLMKGFTTHGYKPNESVKIIVNRFMKRSEITLPEAEKNLSAEIFWTLPEDSKVVNSAINNGKPLIEIAPKANTTKSMWAMAQSLFAPEEFSEKTRRKYFCK